MSRMQKKESLLVIQNARRTRVFARALALTIVTLAVSHAGCDDGFPSCPEIPGTCVSPMPSEKWKGPFALWQGEAAKFALPETSAVFHETKRELFPLDYHPEQDVGPYTCPHCTCVPTDYCYGGAEWTGYRYDCADISGQGDDIWTQPTLGVCYDVGIPFGDDIKCMGTLQYPVSPCAPVTVTEPAIPAPTPERMAVAFDVLPLQRRSCESTEDLCVLSVKDYEICISAPGDVPCEGEWAESNRYVLADGFDDSRKCNNVCECGKQKNSTCEVKLEAFVDSKCTNLVETGQFTAKHQTMAIDPPSPVNSVLVTLTEYTPGTCDLPVGNTQTEPVGDIKQGPTVTFCCR